MSNYIIIFILLLCFFYGIKETVKHFKGEGACCGGSATPVRKKKLSRVTERHLLKIDGMHCKHCENTVTEIINDFDGAAGRVNLKRGQAIVLCETEVDIEAIMEKLKKRGYGAELI